VKVWFRTPCTHKRRPVKEQKNKEIWRSNFSSNSEKSVCENNETKQEEEEHEDEK
jgi:hypothetical protein